MKWTIVQISNLLFSIVWVGSGIVFIYLNYSNPEQYSKYDILGYILGIYGLFRLYRSLKSFRN